MTALTRKEIKKLVRKIFTPGPPSAKFKPAKRLELKDENEKALGGWGEGPLVNFICKKWKIK